MGVGHLALVEAMTHEMLAGEANPIASWGAVFAPGTTPTAKASDYPPFAEVRAQYTQLRKRTLQLLDGLSDTDLDKRVANPPQGLEKHFETYGKALMTLSIHQMIHRSHLTDAVRNAGREVPSAIAA